MKSAKNLIFLLSTLLLSFALNAFGAQRQVVLLEGFTQWNCPPCATWNPQERGLMHAMTRDTVVSIKYHAWWPGANNDAMHLYNVSENTSRINYYNVTGVPALRSDGSTAWNGNQTVASVRTSVRNRFNTASPGTIDDLLALEAGETSISFSCMITAESDMTNPSLRLYAVLITDEIHYSSPPGSNGETQFDDVFRDMWPNSSGQTISLTAGQQQEFTGNLNKNAAWSPDSLSVVVFIQNTSTRAVQQAAVVKVTPQWGMNTNSTGPRQLIVQPNSDDQIYNLSLVNTGNNDETYIATLSGTLPAGWTRSIEAEGVSPNSESIQVPLARLNTSTNLVARLNSHGNPGSATLTVTVTSPNSPDQITASYTYRLMSGLDVLVVDDDLGSAFEPYYETALAPLAQTRVVGRWDVRENALDVSYFEGVDLVVWFTGNDFASGSTLSAMDQGFLEEYLNGGGRLLISGQGIGLNIRNDAFFIDMLHAQFVAPNNQGFNITGVTGDPISDGMAFEIRDGDGADNQNRQHAIRARDEHAVEFLNFTNHADYPAGLRVTGDNGYRVIYLGFGFEAINSSDDREAAMTSMTNWLLQGVTGVDNPQTPATPAEFALGQNYPNPFNPETVIPYALPVRSDVSLKVYDITGREVATLFDGTQEAGNHTANWNAAKFGSGVYFYRLEASNGTHNFKSTQKLVLLK